MIFNFTLLSFYFKKQKAYDTEVSPIGIIIISNNKHLITTSSVKRFSWII